MYIYIYIYINVVYRINIVCYAIPVSVWVTKKSVTQQQMCSLFYN